MVNITDQLILSRYLSGKDGYVIEPKAADVNSDGVVNSSDNTILSEYLAGWAGVVLNCPDI